MNGFPDDFKTPLGMFYQWESLKPDTVWLRQCFRESDTVYTWSQAGDLARKLASGILALGLKPGDRVGIYSQNTAKWVITDLAIMMAGLVSVPIYASMSEEKIKYIVEHSEMKAMFVGDKCAHSPTHMAGLFQGDPIAIGIEFTDSRTGGNIQWSRLLTLDEPVYGNPDWDFDRLWTLSYTSGTTGQPKGVMHSFSSSAYSAYCLNSLASLGQGARFFSYLPLGHISERVIVELHCLFSGGSVGFNESVDTFTDDLKRIRPTYFNAVPRIWTKLKAGIIQQIGEADWQRVINEPEYGKKIGTSILASIGLDQVVWGQAGAAPMPPEDIKAWRCLGMPLVEGYGQTETMNGFFNTPHDFKIGTVGKVLLPGKVKISDDGEILLRSPGNMMGYYKDPARTAETLVEGWIHTGDKGTIDSDGFVTITGRVKDIFKTAKGKYVAPAPIEGKFAFFPGISQCCLVGSGMPQPIMLIVAEESSELTVNQLEEHLDNINRELEAHERISHVIVCRDPWTTENGLLTLTLKMLRTNIENLYDKVVRDIATTKEPRIHFTG